MPWRIKVYKESFVIKQNVRLSHLIKNMKENPLTQKVSLLTHIINYGFNMNIAKNQPTKSIEVKKVSND